MSFLNVGVAMCSYADSRGWNRSGRLPARKGSRLVLVLERKYSAPAAPGFDMLEWRADHPSVLFALVDEWFNGKRSPRVVGTFLDFVCPGKAPVRK